MKKKILETKCDKVLLISFVELLIFIALLLPSKVKVSGIIYSIYLYNKAQMRISRRLLEFIRYQVAVKSKCIERMLILNDPYSVNRLNKIYSTNKFQILVDPVPNVDFQN